MQTPRGLLDPQQAETKRERLLRAAFNVIGERGYESTSVARIARAAPMAPGLVHYYIYYFASKDDLLVALVGWCSHLFDDALAHLPSLGTGSSCCGRGSSGCRTSWPYCRPGVSCAGTCTRWRSGCRPCGISWRELEAEARARVAGIVPRALSLAGGDPRWFVGLVVCWSLDLRLWGRGLAWRVWSRRCRW
jgi:AcrR family transcriptional regulator